MASGFEVHQLIEDGLTKALESLDFKCNNDQLSLLEILLAGRAMMEVMDRVITPYLEKNKDFQAAKESLLKETIILGTIQGDIHDLGKNIVAILLKVSGYRVVDLGKDVAPSVFVEAALRENAKIIGVSSLITSTIPHIRQLKTELSAAGLQDLRVVAGGAALRQVSPKDLNVDLVADNVFDLLNFLRCFERGS